MPPVPEMTTSDQEPQPGDDDGIKLDTVDLEKGIGGTTTSTNTARNGKYLRWARITKEVEIKEGNSGLIRGSIATPTPESTEESKKKGTVAVKKTILNGVSGSAAPGEVLALMGPSGSGKTSILDVLSGRSAYDSGMINLDGEIVTDKVMKKLKKKVAYVKQNDLFFGHLTVRDQLTYTALLRLPSAWPKAQKVAEVDRIIKQLRLTKCADTPIFMVSGGERKRVNIGSELLTDPAIILLDEPTSGLDSTSAVALMRILESLAREEGKTIITSIHQPSSAVFFGFDKLMLLADGNVVYFGTPADSLNHVKSLGLECPAGYNAADHHMDLLVVDSAIDDEDDNFAGSNNNDAPGLVHRGMGGRQQSIGGTTTKQKMINSWDQEDAAKQIEDEVKSQYGSTGRRISRQQSVIMTEKSFNTSWWTQYTVLVHRSMKNSRSAIFTRLNLIKAGAIGLMCGLLWFQMPYTEATVFDRSSYYFFTMTFWVFDAMFTAYMAFPLERSIIFKERSSGAYRLSAYFMAKTTSEAPARLMLPAIYMLFSYWMSGVNNNFGIFISSTLCTLLSVLAGESIGLLLGAAVLDVEKGMVVMTVISLGLMVVGGFFVRQIPFWITWLGYISPFKYSYNASVQLVFDKPVPCDGSGVLSACGGASSGAASVQDVLKFLGVEFSTGFNVAMLLILFVGMRFFAFFALKHKKSVERSN
jgi:ABC-type multidrug transport system ATPase subunit